MKSFIVIVTIQMPAYLSYRFRIELWQLFWCSFFKYDNDVCDCGPGGGGGVLPYMGYIGMCRCEGYGFQAVHSSIGYINQSVWV